MEKISFHTINKNDKLQVIKQVAEQQNLPYFAVEKDWWVTQTLGIIFQLEFADHLLFKVGTSLSKALGADYKTMQSNMIPEDSPSFDDLLETVKQVIVKYNALEFE